MSRPLSSTGGFSYGRGRFQKCHCKSFGLHFTMEFTNRVTLISQMPFENNCKYAKPAISVDIWSNHVKVLVWAIYGL
jgi:penicillin-binding protein 2